MAESDDEKVEPLSRKKQRTAAAAAATAAAAAADSEDDDGFVEADHNSGHDIDDASSESDADSHRGISELFRGSSNRSSVSVSALGFGAPARPRAK